MSGDVQPRKRKNDKKRRRGNENVVHTKCFDFFSLGIFKFFGPFLSVDDIGSNQIIAFLPTFPSLRCLLLLALNLHVSFCCYQLSFTSFSSIPRLTVARPYIFVVANKPNSSQSLKLE